MMMSVLSTEDTSGELALLTHEDPIGVAATWLVGQQDADSAAISTTAVATLEAADLFLAAAVVACKEDAAVVEAAVAIIPTKNSVTTVRETDSLALATIGRNQRTTTATGLSREVAGNPEAVAMKSDLRHLVNKAMTTGESWQSPNVTWHRKQIF